MSSTKKKFNFVLKGVDPDIIYTKYKFEMDSNLKQVGETIPKNCTKIGELSKGGDEIKKFSFVDESKKMHRCCLTMKNHSNGDFLPIKTNIACHWCCHQFSSIPIGCPLRYIPKTRFRKYFSEIIKEQIITKEVVPDNIENENENENCLSKEKTTEHAYYETEGIFCSFNCCYAYIEQNKRNCQYDSSLNLLSFIYQELFDLDFDISPAPDWRLLSLFGGSLDIDNYRDNFYKAEFIYQGKIVKAPRLNQLPINFLYEEKIKF